LGLLAKEMSLSSQVLFKVDDGEEIHNTYVCVDGSGLVVKFRELHPFISKYLPPGSGYVPFDLFGWSCGILICYDINVVENVRATALLGAETILPHVTMCAASIRPRVTFVNPRLCDNTETTRLAFAPEFNGLRG
jgi:predicted amidohydrolase